MSTRNQVAVGPRPARILTLARCGVAGIALVLGGCAGDVAATDDPTIAILTTDFPIPEGTLTFDVPEGWIDVTVRPPTWGEPDALGEDLTLVDEREPYDPDPRSEAFWSQAHAVSVISWEPGGDELGASGAIPESAVDLASVLAGADTTEQTTVAEVYEIDGREIVISETYWESDVPSTATDPDEVALWVPVDGIWVKAYQGRNDREIREYVAFAKNGEGGSSSGMRGQIFYQLLHTSTVTLGDPAPLP